MENDIAKITTPKLALMSDVVASDKKFIRMENGSLTVIAGVLIAVGNSVFKTEKTTLTASNLDGTATKFEVGKDYCFREKIICLISLFFTANLRLLFRPNSIVFSSIVGFCIEKVFAL